ncbi:phage tail protein [Paraburkholderia tropica]|uniref:phage tail protein n=1 Tax=Paraburkholderia tropica TaxID=92647 RepID=UPI001F1C12FB|nr:phage tail protein [Paraburkholderia tropica]
MIDVYAIGATLKLHDLVTPRLLQLSREFAKVDALALQVNKRLKAMGSEVVGVRNLASAAKMLDGNLKSVTGEALNVERNLRGIRGAIPSGSLGIEKELAAANRQVNILGRQLSALRASGYNFAGGGSGGGSGGRPPLPPLPSPNPGGGRRRGHVHGGNMHVGPGGFGIGGVGMGIGSDLLVPLAAGGAAIYVGSMFSKSAGEYQREQAQFSIFGLTDAQNAEAKRFAEQTKMPGASMIDKLRYVNEAQGVFRESGLAGDEALQGAKLVAPILAKLHYSSLLSGHEMDESEEKSMLRFVETRGGLKDPKELARIADLGFKVSMTSGGNVDWEQLRQAMTTGGVAAKGLSDEAMFAWGEPLIGELKGGRFGTGLRTAFNRMNGLIKLPNQAFHEMERLGLWDPSMVVENANGGIKSFKGNPLRHAEEYSANPFKYYADYILPKYDKLGLTQAQRNSENSMIFGNTGSMLFSTLEQQMATIQRSLTALNQANGLDPATKATDATMVGQMKEFDAAWSDFKTTFGQTMLPAVTTMLRDGAAILRTISNADVNLKDEQSYVNQGGGLWDRMKRMWNWHPGMGDGNSHAASSLPPSKDGSTDGGAGDVYLDGNKVGKHVARTLSSQLGSGFYTGSIDNSVSLPMAGLKN